VACASAPTTLSLNDFQVNKKTTQDYQQLKKPGLKISNDPGSWTSINTQKAIICSDSLFPKAELNDKVFCQTTPRQLEAGPDTSAFTYRWNTGDTTPNILIDTSGTYKVSVSYRGCTATDSADITFLRGISPDIGDDTIICESDSLQVRIPKGDTTYLWQPPSANQLSDADTIAQLQEWVKSRGDYQLYRTDAPQCRLDAFTLRKFIRPAVQVKDSSSVCPYDSVKLSPALNNPEAYNWRGLPSDSIFAEASTTWLTDSGSYVLRDDASFCPLDTFKLKHYRLPEAQAGPDTQLCHDQVYTMQGKGGVTFRWIPARYLSDARIPDPKAQLPEKQAYKLIVGNEAGCRDTASVLLDVLPPLKVKVPKKRKICENQPLELTATGQGGRAMNYQFRWEPLGKTGQTVKWQRPVDREVQVTLSDQCSPQVSDTVRVAVQEAPEAAIEVSPKDSVFIGDTVTVTNSGTTAATFWRFEEGNNLIAKASPSHVYETEGKKVITLITENANGCRDMAEKALRLGGEFQVHVPNAFSPNGDGINDQWRVRGLGIERYHFTIYNRWGGEVYTGEGSDGRPQWNGRHEGQEVPAGTYVYTLTVRDPLGRRHFYEGTLRVIR
jgi:gliding motility-associated-like protein